MLMDNKLGKDTQCFTFSLINAYTVAKINRMRNLTEKIKRISHYMYYVISDSYSLKENDKIFSSLFEVTIYDVV